MAMDTFTRMLVQSQRGKKKDEEDPLTRAILDTQPLRQALQRGVQEMEVQRMAGVPSHARRVSDTTRQQVADALRAPNTAAGALSRMEQVLADERAARAREERQKAVEQAAGALTAAIPAAQKPRKTREVIDWSEGNPVRKKEELTPVKAEEPAWLESGSMSRTEQTQPHPADAEAEAVNAWRAEKPALFAAWKKKERDPAAWNALTEAERAEAESWGSRYKALGAQSALYRLRRSAEGRTAALQGTMPALAETAGKAAGNFVQDQKNSAYRAAARDLFGAQQQMEEAVQRGVAEEELEKLRADVAEKQAAVDAVKANDTADMEGFGMRKMGEAALQSAKAVEGLPAGQALAYSAGQSVVDNLLRLPLGSGGLALAGAQSAAQQAYDLQSRGVGAGEALIRGTASGLIEGATEKLGLDNLTTIAKGGDVGAVKGALRTVLQKLAGESGGEALGDVLSQMTAEGLEEVLSYVGNFAVDKMAKDPEAKISAAEILESFLGGAMAGGMLGAGGVAVNRANTRLQNTAYGKQVQATGGQLGLLAQGLSGAEDTAAYKLADELLKGMEQGKAPNAAKLGQLGRVLSESGQTLTDEGGKALLARVEQMAARWADEEAAADNLQINADGTRTLREVTAEHDDGQGTVMRYKAADLSAARGEKRRQLRQVQQVAAALGKNVLFADGAMEENGVVRMANGARMADGTLIVNLKAENPLQVVLGHELLHSIAKGEGTAQLVAALAKDSRYGAELEKALGERIDAYGAAGVQLDAAGALEEIAADRAGELLFDDAMIRYICKENASLGQRILNFIDSIIGLFRGKSGEEVLLGRLSESRRLYAAALQEKTLTGYMDAILDAGKTPAAQTAPADTALQELLARVDKAQRDARRKAIQAELDADSGPVPVNLDRQAAWEGEPERRAKVLLEAERSALQEDISRREVQPPARPMPSYEEIAAMNPDELAKLPTPEGAPTPAVPAFEREVPIEQLIAREEAERNALQAETAEQQKGSKVQSDARYSLKIKHSDGSVEELADARALTNEQAVAYLKQAKASKLHRETYIPVRKDTPQVIVDTLAEYGENVGNLSMVMQVKKAQQAMSSENPGKRVGKHGDNIRKHALAPEEVVEIVNNIDNPNMVILQTNRRGKNGKPLPNNVAVFVEYSNNGKEGLAVIEFESSINPDFIGTEYGDTSYHTVVTVFEPDVEREGVEFDYAEELLSNPDNIELEIKRRQSDESATGEKHPNTSKELPSFKDNVPQAGDGVKPSFTNEEAYRAEPENKKAAQEGGVQYSIMMDANGNPYVQIEEDILTGVSEKDIDKAIKKEIKKRFPDGFEWKGWKIQQTSKGRKEFTNSKYTQRLRNSDPQAYKDKMRMAANLDEIIEIANQIVNEPPKHPRNDKIQSFNRGKLNIAVGNRDYSAEVVTGIYPDTKEIFYDIVKIKTTNIKKLPPYSMPRNAGTVDVGGVSKTTIASGSQTVNTNTRNSLQLAPRHSEVSERRAELARQIEQFKRQLAGEEPLQLPEFGKVAAGNVSGPPEREDEKLSQPEGKPRRNLYVPKAESPAAATDVARALAARPVQGSICAKLDPKKLLAAEKDAYKLARRFEKEAHDIGATSLERDEARKVAKRMASGEFEDGDIAWNARKNVVKELAKISLELQNARENGIRAAKRMITAQQQTKYRVLLNEINEINEEGPLTGQDKIMSYQLNWRTSERVFRKVFGKELGDLLIEDAIDPIHANEAQKNIVLSEMYAEAAKLDLTMEERILTHLAGERGVKGQGLVRLAEAGQLKDTDLPETMDIRQREQLLKNQRKLDYNKVYRAIDWYRSQYDTMLDVVRNFQVTHGIKPIGEIKDYFPHFNEDDPVNKLMKQLGLEGVSQLPTSIAGMTEGFRPNSRYVANFQKRKGVRTTYDANLGFQIYMNAVMDMLYHTDDIIRLRPMDATLRGRFKDADLQRVLESPQEKQKTGAELDEQEAQILDKIMAGEYMREEAGSEYSSFAGWLTDYTNKLANKQLRGDRSAEAWISRSWLNMAGKISSAFAANSVVGNLSSALNNSVTLPKILATSETQDAVRAAMGLANGTFKDSGLAQKSLYLQGKKGVVPLVEQPKARASRWVMDHTFEPIETAVSDMAWYTKYLEATRKGADETEAIKQADKYAAYMMSRRSKGGRPLAMESKGLTLKLLTVFQNEISNDFYSLVEDLPQNYKGWVAKEGKQAAAKKVMGGAAKYMVYAHILNMMLEAVTGYAPAPDPVGWLQDFFATLLDEDSEDTLAERAAEASMTLAGEVAGNVPALPTLLSVFGVGNGRVPLPQFDLTRIGNAVSAMTDEEKDPNEGAYVRDTLLKGAGYPAATLLLPFGGNQLKKTTEGLRTMAKGGVYGQTKKGEQLRVEVDNTDPLKWVQAAFFGPSALPEVRQYYDSGAKAAYSVKETGLRSAAEEVGMTTGQLDAAIEMGDTIDAVSKEDLIRQIPKELREYAQAEKIAIDSKAEAKRVALLMDKELTATQREWLAVQLLGDEPGSRDYTNAGRYRFSCLSDAQQARWQENMSLATKAAWADAYTACKGLTKKAARLAALRSLGYDNAKAERMYKAMFS